MAAGTVVAATAAETAMAVAGAAGHIGAGVAGVAGGGRAAEPVTPASIVFPGIKAMATRRRCRPRVGQWSHGQRIEVAGVLELSDRSGGFLRLPAERELPAKWRRRCMCSRA